MAIAQRLPSGAAPPSRVRQYLRRAWGGGALTVVDGELVLFSGVDGTLTKSAGRVLGANTIKAATAFGAVASVTITSIPQDYAYLYLDIAGASSDTATRHLQIQTSSDNGATWDTTAANYVGSMLAGATVTAVTEATLLQMADVAAANTHDVGLMLSGYNVAGMMEASGIANNGTTKYAVQCSKLNRASINALKILWNSTGNFDAGTYRLVGMR